MIALVLGLVGAVLVFTAANKKSDKASTSSGAGAGIPAVVAKADIPARTKITAAMVEVRLVSQDARSDLGYTDATQVVGQVTRFPISANEQVLSNKVVSLAGTLATSKSLSYVIPQGKRAMSFNASAVQQAGGLILPGDYIDIVALWNVDFPGKGGGERQTIDKYMTQTIMQNVQVLAISQTIVDLVPEATAANGQPAAPSANGQPPASGQPATNNGQAARNTEAKPDPAAATVTLALTPEEAERLYLAEQNGQLRMSLRAYGDSSTRPIDFVTKLELIPQNLPNPLLR
jgi:pilus assembly protein CpaB